MVDPQGAVHFINDYICRYQTTNEMYAQPRTFIPNAIWSSPHVDYIKINIDAALFKVSKSVGVGMVARDHNGIVIAWRHRTFSQLFQPDVAETVAVVEGIKFVVDSGWSKIQIEGDNFSVMAAFRSPEVNLFVVDLFVQEGLNLLASFHLVEFLHIRREENVIAHRLAKEVTIVCDGDFILPF